MGCAKVNQQKKNQVTPTKVLPSKIISQGNKIQSKRLESVLVIQFICSEITFIKFVTKRVFQSSFESIKVSQLNDCSRKRISRLNNPK